MFCRVVDRIDVTGYNAQTHRYRNGAVVKIEYYFPDIDDYLPDTIWVNASICPQKEIIIGDEYQYSITEKRFVNYFKKVVDPYYWGTYGTVVPPN